MTDAPHSLAEVLRRALDARLLDVHVSLPARVVSYSASSQTATVRPMIPRVLRDSVGERVVEGLPLIPNVPICFPRGGGFFCSFPLAVGDTVMLVFAERSLDRWRSTGEVVDPADTRTHSLAGAWAYPGGFPTGDELDDADASSMVIGKDGGPQVVVDGSYVHVGGDTSSQFVALANLVAAELVELKTAIDLAVPLAGDGGAQFKSQLMTALESWPSSVAATKAKAV
jgi:hypothetical protein